MVHPIKNSYLKKARTVPCSIGKKLVVQEYLLNGCQFPVCFDKTGAFGLIQVESFNGVPGVQCLNSAFGSRVFRMFATPEKRCVVESVISDGAAISDGTRFGK